MELLRLIEKLQEIYKEYGDIKVVGYDYSEYNSNLADAEIKELQVFRNKNDEDYLEIGFGTTTKLAHGKELLGEV